MTTINFAGSGLSVNEMIQKVRERINQLRESELKFGPSRRAGAKVQDLNVQLADLFRLRAFQQKQAEKQAQPQEITTPPPPQIEQDIIITPKSPEPTKDDMIITPSNEPPQPAPQQGGISNTGKLLLAAAAYLVLR